MRIATRQTCGVFEDRRRIRKVDPMLGNVRSSLGRIPFEPHASVYAQMYTRQERRSTSGKRPRPRASARHARDGQPGTHLGPARLT